MFRVLLLNSHFLSESLSFRTKPFEFKHQTKNVLINFQTESVRLFSLGCFTLKIHIYMKHFCWSTQTNSQQSQYQTSENDYYQSTFISHQYPLNVMLPPVIQRCVLSWSSNNVETMKQKKLQRTGKIYDTLSYDYKCVSQCCVSLLKTQTLLCFAFKMYIYKSIKYVYMYYY